MAIQLNTDYLRFNANSMKDLIKQKLSENSSFTDHLFEDSNMTTMIDVFSYMYSTLMFYLNNAASESIFTDSQLYENMNRISKMLGYNPTGFVTSTLLARMTVDSSVLAGMKTIPKYTKYTTSLTDKNGMPVNYSFIDNYTFVTASNGVVDSLFTPQLYNGTWKLYDNIFVSSGIPNETYILSLLNLQGLERKFIAHNKIDVYVKDSTGIKPWKSTLNLYTAT